MTKLPNRYILLSLDVEEFDLPIEYGSNIPESEQFEISKYGLESLLNLFSVKGIRTTLFTTATFAQKYPELIKTAAQQHEIASHGLNHLSPTDEGIVKSKKILEQIAEKEIKGFRCPRLQKINEKNLIQNGFTYNSSENPIYLPGRYNNFFKKRTAYITENNLLNIPISASPVLRFPLFWLAFKNLPLSVVNFFSKWTLLNDNYLNIFYHPWEFKDLSLYQIPGIVKKQSGDAMLEKLSNYISYLLSLNSTFITISEYETLFRNSIDKR